MTFVIQLAVVFITFLALAFMVYNFHKLRNMEEGTKDMSDIAAIIRRGARRFMRAEYYVIIPTVLIVAAIFSCFIEKTSGFTFMAGALMSSLACVIGMRSGSYANVRTTATALRTGDIGKTTQTALLGGSISGIGVQAFGLFGIMMIHLIAGGVREGVVSSGFFASFTCNPTVLRFTTYSLGCSLVAMFNRVAGGNYTKAADISADIVGKRRHDLPEDDSRMPNTIADFIGDLVNDIAGNCSDLLESTVSSIVACSVILNFVTRGSTNVAFMDAASIFPIIISGGGLLASVVGIFFALNHKASSNPTKELNNITYMSSATIMIIALIASVLVFGNIELIPSFRLGWISPFIALAAGVISGVLIGKITEHYTGAEHKPVKLLAQIAREGDAFVVTKGDAIGERSCFPVMVVIVIAMIVAGVVCDVYGIAIAALGMLSFVGATVSIDAFGPIADNAGGICESCLSDQPEIRAITDKLDELGNMTAAIGKGFAICSSMFASTSLIIGFIGSFSSATPVLNIASYVVFAGGVIGVAVIKLFSGMLTDNTIKSAVVLADEGERQLDGILNRGEKPDYDTCISLAARNALIRMAPPSLMTLLVPVFGFIFFGPTFVGGILVGSTLIAIGDAIFHGNSGGAFDNAKKLIEEGRLLDENGVVIGKKTDAHKAAITGDTVGDTRKDVVGVALDIAIKEMSTVANTLAPVFANNYLFSSIM